MRLTTRSSCGLQSRMRAYQSRSNYRRELTWLAPAQVLRTHTRERAGAVPRHWQTLAKLAGVSETLSRISWLPPQEIRPRNGAHNR
jgi:ribosomal protein L34E